MIHAAAPRALPGFISIGSTTVNALSSPFIGQHPGQAGLRATF